MSKKITSLREKLPNGSYSDAIPFQVTAQNVKWDQNGNDIQDVIGDIDLTKGSIVEQLAEKTGTDNSWMLLGGIRIGTDSENHDDLNTIITPGNYYCYENFEAPNVDNLPSGWGSIAFTLKVETSAGKLGDGDAVINEYPYQTLRAWNTSHYMVREGRPIKENNVITGWNWTSWKELINDKTDIALSNKNLRQIPDNTELNLFLTPGIYCGSDAFARGITINDVSIDTAKICGNQVGHFYLFVTDDKAWEIEQYNSQYTGFIRQYLVTTVVGNQAGAGGAIYVRRCNAPISDATEEQIKASWTDWAQLTVPGPGAQDAGKVLKARNDGSMWWISQTELPEATYSTPGQVLTVVNGGYWGIQDPTKELPVVSGSDNGKLLGVDNGSWQAVNAPTELPTVTADDNGDVLTVVEGAWSKAAPAGGSNVVIFEKEVTDLSTPETIINLSIPFATLSEIDTTINAGKVVIMRFTATSGIVRRVDVPVNHNKTNYGGNSGATVIYPNTASGAALDTNYALFYYYNRETYRGSTQLYIKKIAFMSNT